MDIDQWDDLLLSGGFAPRKVLLRGLSVSQAGQVPSGAPHSIYQELWHATRVLEMSLAEGRVVLEGWPLAEHFPLEAAPTDQATWDDLVARFMAASEKAVEMSAEPGLLASKEPGYDSTWRESFEFLAVHTAYHLGKIVLLRQLLGSWPPPPAPAAGT